MSRVGVVVGLLAYVMVLAGCSDDDDREPRIDDPIRTESSPTSDGAVPQVVEFRLVWAAQEAPGDGTAPPEPGLTAPRTGGKDTPESSAPPADVDWSGLSEEQSIDIANSTPTSGIGTPPAGYAEAFDQLTRQMNELDCGTGGPVGQLTTSPGMPLVTCGEDGAKYVLSPAVIGGQRVTDASATVPQNGASWIVQLRFDSAGTEALARISEAMTGSGSQFAVVADGAVLSAPEFEQPITNGEAQIAGDFDEKTADGLADALESAGR